MEQMLAALQSAFPMKEIPLGEDARQRVRPMTFQLRQFAIADMGNLSLMRGSAMLGLMRMETLILMPTTVDAPMFSYDRIRAMGNDTLIAEWYDTFVSPPDATRLQALEAPKSTLDSVPAHDLGVHWYDSLKLPASCSYRGRGCAAAYRAYLDVAVQSYIQLLRESPAVDETAKKRKNAEYVDGLFQHGGPSTDAFVKALGREKAKRLFDQVVFGVA